MKHALLGLLISLSLTPSAFAAEADAWSCTYVEEGEEGTVRQIEFHIEDDALVSNFHNSPIRGTLVQNDEVGIIPSDAGSGPTAHFGTMMHVLVIMIRRSDGSFLMSGSYLTEVDDFPSGVLATGYCITSQ
jgi:hypothetical protein